MFHSSQFYKLVNLRKCGPIYDTTAKQYDIVCVISCPLRIWLYDTV